MTTVLDASAGPGERGRGRLPRVAAAIVVALGLGGLAGWQWEGHHPAVRPGSESFAPGDPIRTAGDGVASTRYVLDGSRSDGGVLRFSLRNDGPVPFTVRGLAGPAADPSTGLWEGVQFALLAREGGTEAFDGPLHAAVRVDPGREAAIVLRAHVPRCLSFGAGTGTSTDTVGLSVEQLGITTTQQLRLPLPLAVQFPEGHIVPPGCPNA